MNISLFPSFLRLKKRLITLPPFNPTRETLNKIKNAPVEYPPELLKARREAFIRRIDETKAGRIPVRPAGS